MNRNERVLSVHEEFSERAKRQYERAFGVREEYATDPVMKSKNYWESVEEGEDPFLLPKRISRGIARCAEQRLDSDAAPVVRYIWIYVTDDGLRPGYQGPNTRRHLGLDDWLNVIDESASLGAEWMVIHVGASLSQCPMIWKMCEWAQDVHRLHVGLHLSSACLSEDDVERLARLDPEHTHLVADRRDLQGLKFLEERGIRLCEANLRPEEHATTCRNPQSIACVGPDGTLFSCGLVLGDRRFALGEINTQPLRGVMEDGSLPHVVKDTTEFPTRGCDGCPSHMVNR